MGSSSLQDSARKIKKKARKMENGRGSSRGLGSPRYEFIQIKPTDMRTFSLHILRDLISLSYLPAGRSHVHSHVHSNRIS